MIIAALNTKNPTYDEDLFEDNWALYAGDLAFRKRIKRFLVQNPQEDPAIYDKRCEEAVYRSYIAAVTDYFSAMMFGSGKLEMIPKDEDGETMKDVPPLCREYLQDCDGAGTDFVDQLRRIFVEQMTRGGMALATDFPGLHASEVPETQAEWEALGWGKVKTKLYSRNNVFDWEKDRKGNLEWIIVYEKRIPRPSWQDMRTFEEHVWRIYDREFVTEFVLSKKQGERIDPQRDEALQTGVYRHNLGFVPVVFNETPNQLWITDKLKSAQLEHFRLSAAQNWGIRRSCFAMPVIYMDGDMPQQTFGHGYMMQLPFQAKADWLAPDVKYMEFTQREIKSQKDEIYRAIGQMSLSMDNTAVVVGRSAESKMADAESVRTLLNAYGAYLRTTAENIMKMVGSATGETTTWTASGLDRAVSTDPMALSQTLLSALDLGVMSDTFWQLAHQKLAVSTLPEATYDEREKMRLEIEKEEPVWRQRKIEQEELLLDTEEAKAHALTTKSNANTPAGQLAAHGQEARSRISGDPAASIEDTSA